MTQATTPEHARLIRKLDSISVLSEEDREAIRRLPFREKLFGENQDLVRQGDRPSECCLLVEGFVCRYKVLGEGQRQIMSFHLPGDIPDLQSLHLKVMDHSLGALTPVRVAFIPHEALEEITHTRPTVTAAFWRDTLIDASVFREWLAGVGRRSAYQRIAHLICELCTRLKALGLIDENSFQLMVTQAEVADALGLSSVHVNRVLQDLRRDGLIAIQGRVLKVLDWEGLKEAGDFDSEYLHLRHDPS